MLSGSEKTIWQVVVTNHKLLEGTLSCLCDDRDLYLNVASIYMLLLYTSPSPDPYRTPEVRPISRVLFHPFLALPLLISLYHIS